MAGGSFKKSLSSALPYMERLAVDTARGYAFGCVFGIFAPSSKPLLQSMHRSGKSFAKMSAAYSAAEMSMEMLRKKDDVLNSVVAGVAAGAVGSRRGIVPGSAVFGAYSGLSAYFQTLGKKH